MLNRPLKIIFNPTAGQGSAGDRLADVEQKLTQSGIVYELVQTEYHGHAIELATESANAEVSGVVAAGGDGTANEVLNGMLASGRSADEIPPMGILPIGRGNDFAYAAGVPGNLDEAISLIASGEIRSMDAGHLTGGNFPEGRYFGNGIGIGFDTIVGFEAAKMTRIKGFAGYVIGAIKTISLYYVAPLIQLRYNGAEFASRSIQISVMNGRRMGGTFYMAPKAANDDGLLDLCIAGEPKRRQMLGLIVKYLKGTQADSAFIRMERTKEIAIEALDGTLAVHADGETVCEAGKRLEVRCVAGAIRVFTKGLGG